ncbi:MAG: putative metal-binding motif-containing protein [Desulfobacterota bacterium]|nr:putative metal-binding motif-containing protein [Thermodesulfobacteriota bacterium]
MKKTFFILLFLIFCRAAAAEDCEVWLGHWKVKYQDGSNAHWVVDWATNEPLSSGSRCQAKGVSRKPDEPDVLFQIRWFVYVNAYIYVEHQGDLQQTDKVTEMVLSDDLFTVRESDHGIASGERIICTDVDKDGYYREGGACGPADCTDNDSGVHPGIGESCNDGKDNNCNSAVDEICSGECTTDRDDDGFFTDGGACGSVDCDDANAGVNQNAQEVCGDGKDNNCDGQVDEDCSLGCIDTDGDGYGINCMAGSDCDDRDPHVHPGKDEICGDKRDNNCNGTVDEGCGLPRCTAAALLGEDDSRLETLRTFRDEVLAKTWGGRSLIEAYYRTSEDLVAMCFENPVVKQTVTNLLRGAIEIIELSY